jgi:hydrogenase nickel incorporation protein HypB
MCSTCGCGHADEAVKILRPGENGNSEVVPPAAGEQNVENGGHHHHGNHDHGHHHHGHDEHHHHSQASVIELEANVLRENDMLAQRNRGYLEAKDVFALNLVSSPGSGKTTISEKSINNLKNDLDMAIIEGDQQSMNDADRIAATGAAVVQVNTGKGCHLDAHMVLHAIRKLDVKNGSLLFIENVGNLVCPSMFDLGENKRVVIISVTQGEDKPLKYPYMFESSQICIINKIDLLPYLDFDVEKMKEYALRINHHLQFFELSATTGEGLAAWFEWLRGQKIAK